MNLYGIKPRSNIDIKYRKHGKQALAIEAVLQKVLMMKNTPAYARLMYRHNKTYIDQLSLNEQTMPSSGKIIPLVHFDPPVRLKPTSFLLRF